MATTLKDIAQACGLAVSTVSNILNGNATSFASDEVKVRVRETALRLGYRKNYLSTSLKTGRTRSVGLIVDAVTDRTRQDFLAAFVEDFSRVGIEVAVSEHRLDAGRASGALEAFGHRQKDAVVLFTDLLGRPEDQTQALGRAVDAFPGRVLGIGSSLRGRLPCLDIDRSAAANRSVGHLLGSSDRVLVAYGDPWELRPRFDFWEDPRVVLWSGIRTGAEFLGRWAGESAGIGGVFFRTDAVAIPVLREWARTGLRVPEDVEVVSFDNFPFSEHTRPALSTWDIGFQRLGHRSQALLAGWLAGTEVPKDHYESFQPEAVVRESQRGIL